MSKYQIRFSPDEGKTWPWTSVQVESTTADKAVEIFHSKVGEWNGTVQHGNTQVPVVVGAFECTVENPYGFSMDK